MIILYNREIHISIANLLNFGYLQRFFAQKHKFCDNFCQKIAFLRIFAVGAHFTHQSSEIEFCKYEHDEICRIVN